MRKVFITSASLPICKHGTQVLKKLKQSDANRSSNITTSKRFSKNVYQFAKTPDKSLPFPWLLKHGLAILDNLIVLKAMQITESFLSSKYSTFLQSCELLEE